MQGTNAHLVAIKAPSQGQRLSSRSGLQPRWQRQSLWVLPHPHLLLASAQPIQGVISFQANLLTPRLAFLKEHCVTHSPVFPGSGYFEAGAAALATLQWQKQRGSHKGSTHQKGDSPFAGFRAVLTGTTIPTPLQLTGLQRVGGGLLLLQTSIALTTGAVEIASLGMQGRVIHARGHASVTAVTSKPSAGNNSGLDGEDSASRPLGRAAFNAWMLMPEVSTHSKASPAAVGSVADPIALTHPATDGFRCHPAMGDNVLQLGQTLIASDVAPNSSCNNTTNIQTQSKGVFVPAALGAFIVGETSADENRHPFSDQQDIWAAIGPAASAPVAAVGAPSMGTHFARSNEVTSNALASADGLSGAYCTASRLTCKRMNLQAPLAASSAAAAAAMSHAPVAKDAPAADIAATAKAAAAKAAAVAPNADCCYQISFQASRPKLTALTARGSRIAHPHGSRGMKLLGSPSGSVQLASLLALVQGTLGMPQGTGNPHEKTRSVHSSTPGMLLRGHAFGQSGCSATRPSGLQPHCGLPSLHAMLKAAHQEAALTASCIMSDPHSPHSITTSQNQVAVSVFDEGKWVPGDVHGSQITANVSNDPLLVRSRRPTPTLNEHLTMSSEGRFQLIPAPRGRLNGLKPVILESSAKTLGENEVLVAVEAVGLNFRDVLNVLGLYPGDAGMPGSDVAGRIVAGQVLNSQGDVLAGPGDAVLGLTTGALASHVVCSAQTLVSTPPPTPPTPPPPLPPNNLQKHSYQSFSLSAMGTFFEVAVAFARSLEAKAGPHLEVVTRWRACCAWPSLAY